MTKFAFLPPSKEEIAEEKGPQGPEMSRRGFLKGGAARAAMPVMKAAKDPLAEEAEHLGAAYNMLHSGSEQHLRKLMKNHPLSHLVEHAVKGFNLSEKVSDKHHKWLSSEDWED